MVFANKGLQRYYQQQNESFLHNGNALLMNIMGAHIVSIKPQDDFMASMEKIAKDIETKGGKPYIIPFGGSNLLGALGYVDCIEEIIEQSKEKSIDFPDYIFTAIGSGGTQSGLLAGIKKNKLESKVIGISVLHKKDIAERIVSDLTFETLKFLSIETESKDNINIDDNFIGGGYGFTTESSIEVIKLVATLEGIFLDPVYTAKAMTGLIDYIKKGKIQKDDSVLFIHTGGSPLIYAYYDKLFD